MSENFPIGTCTIIGPHTFCSFFIKGEDVDYLGSHLYNYTIHAILKNSNPVQETTPQKVILTSNRVGNKAVFLEPQGVWAPHILIASPDNNQIVKTKDLAPCRAATPDEAEAPGCLKVEGDAWVDDKNKEGSITDIWVTVMYKFDLSKYSWKVDGKATGVHLGQPKARRTTWYLNWEVGKIDTTKAEPAWSQGDWIITVKTFDGFYWSDNIDRGGRVVDVNLTLIQPPSIFHPPTIFAGASKEVQYQYYQSGIKITHNDAKITVNDKNMKIIRYEWAFEEESHVDWAYIPQDCAMGQACTIPSVDNVYNTTGIHTAYFTAVDNRGNRWMDSKKIQIDRTAPPAKSPIEDFVNAYFVPLALLAILIMIVAILANVMSRKRMERRLEELSSTHRIEVHANTCDRCGDPLQEGTTACKRCDATDYLSSIQQVILEIKGSGVNVIDAEAMLEDAVSLYDQGQYEPAKQKAYEAQVKANELRGKYVETTEMISQWESKINKIKDDAGGVKLEQCEAETTVYHARLALGRGDFQMVHDYLSKIDPAIEAMRGQVKVKVVENRIGVVERMIANVQGRGIKVLEAEDILRKAKDTFGSGDYEAAHVQAERAEKAIKRTNMIFIESSERISQVEERMAKADKKGEADIVAQGRTALEKMKAAFLDGLYDNVMEIWKEVDKVLPALRVSKKLAWEKEATRLTVEGSADAKVEAEEKPPAALAADIQKAEAKAAAEARKPTQAEAAELLQKCYDRIMLARQNAIETTDADELYNDARKEMEAANYDVAVDYSRNAIFLMEELLQVMGVKIPEEKKPEPVPEVPKVEERPPEPEVPKVEKRPVAAAEETICPSCGKKVKARWATCPYCGITLLAEAPPEKPVEEVQGYGPVEKRPTMPYGPEGKVEEVKTQEYMPQETRVKEYIGGETTEGYRQEKLATKEYMPEHAEITPEEPKVEEKPVEAPVAAVPDKVKCLICGRDVKSKWKTCPYCGATLGEGTVTAPPVPVEAPPPAEVKPKCPGCGKDIKLKWKTCPYCGAATGGAPAPAPAPEPAPASDKSKCPGCGKDVKPKWRTCPYCGASI